jgi:hypothetical protein
MSFLVAEWRYWEGGAWGGQGTSLPCALFTHILFNILNDEPASVFL